MSKSDAGWVEFEPVVAGAVITAGEDTCDVVAGPGDTAAGGAVDIAPPAAAGVVAVLLGNVSGAPGSLPNAFLPVFKFCWPKFNCFAIA